MTTSLCNGFLASGVSAGIKLDGALDLGLIYSEVPANAAGVFTRNQVKAAPVLLDMDRLKGGLSRAIIVNSGNANCGTGLQGMADAVAMGRVVADGLSIEEQSVLVASTGVIGQPLPVDAIAAAVPRAIQLLVPEGFGDFSRAIMTTDTVPKLVSIRTELDGIPFTTTAMAKGSGMVHPDLATMLCFICTDAGASSAYLQQALKAAVNRTLNRITIDGDTSTNDTALLLANGQSGAHVKSSAHRQVFQNQLETVLLQIGKLLVRDGEGATKLAEIRVSGAASERDAYEVANTIATSNLVKTAMFGEDANWGRILAAAGRSGIAFDPQQVTIAFDHVILFRHGQIDTTVEALATAVLQKPEFSIRLDLNQGASTASVYTCDFSIDYVHINADYRT
jgi:glutamate N-acetyltransferase/amino-acid N-acetyltransferase